MRNSTEPEFDKVLSEIKNIKNGSRVTHVNLVN